MSLTVTCSVSEADYVAAHSVHLRPRPFLKTVGLLLLALALAGSVLMAYQMRNRALLYPPFWMIAIPTLYFLFDLLVWRPRRVRQLYHQDAHPGRPFTFAADSMTAELHNETGHARFPWSDLRKWKEGEKVILLYHNDDLYHIIPKACLSADQLTLLREILSSQLPRVA